ncbi:MAG: hypothetical protein A4S17_13665 [Proteobacteria bacterium HN_bin10]|jgi:hypothetical protein|nr:MAG: hypothetical protein A4S17_13665 [Proteobacteria bacterium HN_bin10]
MADTTILIENPEIVRDIERLAARTGKPAVDAVAEAVRAQLGGASAQRTPEEIAERRRKIDALLAEIDALPHVGEPLTDNDLYDEDGMPR